MRILMNVVSIVGVLFAAMVLGTFAWLGVFDRVSVGEHIAGPYTIVYRESSRADHGEFARVTTELHAALTEAGITHADPFDVFRPDGHNDIGFRVAEQDTGRLRLLGPSWNVRMIEAAPSMTARVPWRSPLSFVVGYFKVDPALRDWRSKHGYSKSVAYVIHEGATDLYVQPIVKSAD
jgi:hypothetical protein